MWLLFLEAGLAEQAASVCALWHQQLRQYLYFCTRKASNKAAPQRIPLCPGICTYLGAVLEEERGRPN